MTETLDEAFSRCEKLEAESKAVNLELLELVTALDFELPGELVEDNAPRVYKPFARSARLQGGKDPQGIFDDNGKNLVYASGNIAGRTNEKTFDAGKAVIFSKTGTIGKPRYTEKEFWHTGNTTAVFSRNENRNLTKFFYYWMRSFDYTDYVVGSVIQTLPSYRINNLPYPQVPIEEQRRICETLDKQRAFTEAVAPRLRALADLSEQRVSSLIDECVDGTRIV